MVNQIGNDAAQQLIDDMELIQVYSSFKKDDYLSGKSYPSFFGSALNNFGVKELLDCFIDIAPPLNHAQPLMVL